MMNHRPVRIAALALGIFLANTALAFGQVSQASERFQHEEHATYECAECHSTGSSTVESNRKWCADCHHVEVGYDQCRQCHTVREIAPEPVRAIVRFKLPDTDVRTRSLLFDHNLHGSVGCGACHTGGAELLAESNCENCHTDHHKPGVDCLACHSEPLVTAHPETVHLDLAGCGAAGCHVAEGIDYAVMVDERNLCVSCHVAERDHELPEPCVDCHIMGETDDRSGASP